MYATDVAMLVLLAAIRSGYSRFRVLGCNDVAGRSDKSLIFGNFCGIHTNDVLHSSVRGSGTLYTIYFIFVVNIIVLPSSAWSLHEQLSGPLAGQGILYLVCTTNPQGLQCP
ncbi:hypothetical protein RSOLAG1IB_12624 [Rhizoctonia solani AG-1 IB]|uniref:Uncharacterized protein n=1 Tax=Thanatephorus cucumeris (strain AG1-IB / isolate 7/3/14) TaxID=1108050 RepID=A0A0B7G3B5_THACB|nr:hypothetical protein RSOLAG1IB_12624 [Rhizoctonia solani AG-1 IB]